ncbi:MAG TPA: GNAT family N-acetyltransferase [Caldilineaceae bacterium]|nr:GNAT family N-acetyltransferase [Caldilineaceae bacterium]
MSTSDPIAIEAILARDPVWAIYALADLQPAFARFSHWQIGSSAEGEAVVLLFTALDPPVLFSMGPVDAVADALRQMTLPPVLYLTMPENHLALLTPQYRCKDGPHHMSRMWRQEPTPAAMPSLPGLIRLERADSERIRQLYSHGGQFTPDAFDPYQLDDGVFFGVAGDGGELLAVGGTHIIDRQHHAGAIGNMYTHPGQRGRGFASAVLSAIVYTMQNEGITTIALNVDQENPSARRIYQQHGFQIHLPYVEGVVESVRSAANGR